MNTPLSLRKWCWNVLALIAIVASFSREIKCNIQRPYKKWHKQQNLQAPGPWVLQSHGKIWPKPQLQTDDSEIFFTLNSTNFSFKVSSYYVLNPFFSYRNILIYHYIVSKSLI